MHLKIPLQTSKSSPRHHPMIAVSSLRISCPCSAIYKGLYAALQNPENLNAIERNCLYHDIALYKLNTKMSEAEFTAKLKSNFLKHPFIVAFLDAVRNCEAHWKTPNTPSMRFGAVEAWFAANTTEVPAPRRWELEPYVQVLYEWIQELSNGEFTWSVPGRHSQVLFYNG